MENDYRSLFLEVYGKLPRAGPGGDHHTAKAVELIDQSSPGFAPATVLDLGCGPGAQTLALAAALPEAQILAVDNLPPMVDEAGRRIDVAGIGDRVAVVLGDMGAPPVEAQSQDLIWCEGAIYNLGVTPALEAWRPFLRTGGVVAFTEPVWLVDPPPAEIYDWWTAEYPAITDQAGVQAQVESAGYETLNSFVLPPSAWWDEYYQPMEDRVADLRRRFPEDPVAAEVAAGAEAEIDYFRRFSTCYSYQFFLVQPKG